jgi:hypothetical protein
MLSSVFVKINVWFQKASLSTHKNPELISFLTLRKSVGYLGISLPIVLIIGSFVFTTCHEIQPSISHYYYTNMREIFVGVLCAVGLFLISYNGYSNLDNIASKFAGVLSFGVALFPTDVLPKEQFPCQEDLTSFIKTDIHSTIHFTCAALFFITLALMSIFLFTKSAHSHKNQTKSKQKRNWIYIFCGCVMILSIASIGLYFWFWKGTKENHTVFWFETIALVFFGLSWLTKGEALLKD